MTALSANLDTERKDGEIIRYPVLASATIYKGALVVDLDTGYASAGADASGALFLGVAVEKEDNSSGGDAGKAVRVNKKGTYIFSKTTAVQTDVGLPMYITDDQTVATSSSHSVLAGYCVDVPDSSHVRIRIDAAVR